MQSVSAYYLDEVISDLKDEAFDVARIFSFKYNDIFLHAVLYSLILERSRYDKIWSFDESLVPPLSEIKEFIVEVKTAFVVTLVGLLYIKLI